MRPVVFLFACAGCLAVSLLTVFSAPPWVWTWKLAILAGEFGHWLAVGSVIVTLSAAAFLAGGPRSAAVGLGVVATGLFLRPVVFARALARTLPGEMSAAFGGREFTGSVFSTSKLFQFGSGEKVPFTTEVYAHPDSTEQHLDFYPPDRGLAKDSTGRLPACVVVIHGGGWNNGDRTQLPGLNHRLARRGYAVAAIDYRLAPHWQWPAPKDDTLAAIAWLKANAGRLGFDPANIILLGRSAGGQIAEAVGYAVHDPAIRGVISYYGPSDLVFGYRNASENDAIRSPSLMRGFLGGTPDEQPARYADASALGFVGRQSPPTLMIHGRLDTLVWHRHDERLTVKLAENGVPHYFLSMPWATHGFDFNPNGPGGQLADFAVFAFLEFATAPRR